MRAAPQLAPQGSLAPQGLSASTKPAITLVAACLLWGSAAAGAESGTSFDEQVAPIIARRCLPCHRGPEAEAQLDLARRETAVRGGESGPALTPGDPQASLLWRRVEAQEMPPDHPLPEAERQVLRRWIEGGAAWGADPIDPFRYSSDRRAGYDWWSLQPLQQPSLPAVRHAAWCRNPIDYFVLAQLEARQLQPARCAERRVLARRVSFDLTGLPLSDERLQAFLRDSRPDAYQRLVDELLSSPHYGERWGRFWLDAVRYGESNGFEYDEPRDDAWPYRNWVIDALNRDLPYGEFARRQLAGDVQPGDAQGLAAAGFLVAGPHNTTLPSSEKMRMSMRQDEVEDLVGVICQTFLGLTANCARCHDHKFDPISQREYYQLAATVAGVQPGPREMISPRDRQRLRRIKELKQQAAQLRQQLSRLEELADAKLRPAADPPPRPLARWEFDSDLRDGEGRLHGVAHGDARLEDGALVLGGDGYVETAPLAADIQEKTLEAWVRLATLDQRGGGAISLHTRDGGKFDAIVFGEQQPRRWMAGSNNFARTQSFEGPAENGADTQAVRLAIVYQRDGVIRCYRDGQPYGRPYDSGDLQPFASGQSTVLFGLRHLPAKGNRLLRGEILRAQLHDRALSPAEVAASAQVPVITDQQRRTVWNESQQRQHQQWRAELQQAEAELAELTAIKTPTVYSVAPGDPSPVHVLRRGDVTQPQELVAAAGLTAVQGLSADLQLSPDAPEAERRRRLAGWVSDHHNPLFARVMANRLWHHHFGSGLVETPNDFGFNGGRPSHPQLLEHLALELLRSGGHLKPLHRQIVTSAAYQQSAAANARAESVDADNRLLWHRRPRRLEAEALRDAMLMVAGQLDRTVGGRGFRDVRHFKYRGSNFYEPLLEDGPQFYRRTVYRFAPRGGRNPFLDTFDCPDPSTATPSRATTTTPLQALALQNNDLVLRMSDCFAERVRRLAGDEAERQVDVTFRLAYGRSAQPPQRQVTADFVRQHGLAALCRVVFNSNEFLYVR